MEIKREMGDVVGGLFFVVVVIVFTAEIVAVIEGQMAGETPSGIGEGSLKADILQQTVVLLVEVLVTVVPAEKVGVFIVKEVDFVVEFVIHGLSHCRELDGRQSHRTHLQIGVLHDVAIVEGEICKGLGVGEFEGEAVVGYIHQGQSR